ncbi:hypothetical protein EVG20_g633 [Dentipellis fragilis]|uniref:F-box domain-containing protein n=1 Tax=Dentipellis fragilis TaxID=205917 RepID=A0A4Y9ZD40_9AGAM|nr:hypothetical protein EVG20_g633 [Dentipellis fragilis]
MPAVDTTISALEYWRNAEEQRFAHDSDCPQSFAATEYITKTRNSLALEMDAIALVMCSLRTRFNATAHVNRLPPEILARIFDLVQDIYPLRVQKHGERKGAYVGWLRVTYVCRQWRFAALNHSNLWSNVDLGMDSQWPGEFLRRAQSAPILFKYNMYACNRSAKRSMADVADIVKNHLYHIQELHLLADMKDSQFLTGEAPVLERVVLLDQPPNRKYTGQLLSLPTNLFSCNAPRLRELDISRFNFAWPSLALFGGLVELAITQPGHGNPTWRLFAEPPAALRGFQEFVGALSRMPALESLSIDSAVPLLPLGSTSHTMHAPVATLPNLRTFYLGDHVLKCAVAMNHICMPSITAQEVICTGDDDSERSSEAMIPWFTSLFSDLVPVRVLQIGDWTNGFNITWDSFRAKDDDSEEKCQCNLFFNDSIDRSIAQLKAFCDVLPLESLEKICVEFSDDSSWGVSDWSTFFRRCKNLRHLRVVRSYPIGLSDASNSPMEEPTERLFPFLKTLTFIGMNLKNRPDLRELCRNLVPSQKITLMDCTVDKAAISKLREEGIMILVEEAVSSGEDSESDAASSANMSN